MKSLVTMVVASVMALLLTACGGESKQPQPQVKEPNAAAPAQAAPAAPAATPEPAKPATQE